MPVDRQVIAEIIQADLLAQTQAQGTVLTLVTSGTIPSNIGSVRVTAGAAVTAIIVQPGTKQGQILGIIHEGSAANTITMAASGTSNVANGVLCIITGPAMKFLQWDAVTALWYSPSTT